MSQFYNANQAQMRLDKSVANVNGDLSWIDGLNQYDRGYSVIHRKLDTPVGPSQSTPLDTVKVSTDGLRSGMMNKYISRSHKTGKFVSKEDRDYVPEAQYVKRIPYRMWKIGMNTGNTLSLRLTKKPTGAVRYGGGGNVSSRTLISPYFVNMLKQDYPDISDAMGLCTLSKGRYPVGISKSFAVWEDGTLSWANYGAVGTINEKGSFKLDKKFFFLEELLRKELPNAE